MDLPDDADGRVVIFALDDPGDGAALVAPPPGRGGAVDTALDRLGAALDGPYAGIVVAIALAVVLALALVLLRR